MSEFNDGIVEQQSQSQLYLQILNDWENIAHDLYNIFDKRDRNAALAPMSRGIRLFSEFLYLANGYKLAEGEPIEYNRLTVQPINLEERLEFIKKRPNLYQSYLQLQELMNEMKKKYEISIALSKSEVK